MWRTFIPLATHHFPDRHTYSVHSVQCCHFSCFEQFCWDVIRTCCFATCCLIDRTSNLWMKWWRLLLPVPFPSSSWYKTSQYSFHMSAFCSASVKFLPVADWIHCRRGSNFRFIDLTICHQRNTNHLYIIYLFKVNICMSIDSVKYWKMPARVSVITQNT